MFAEKKTLGTLKSLWFLGFFFLLYIFSHIKSYEFLMQTGHLQTPFFMIFPCSNSHTNQYLVEVLRGQQVGLIHSNSEFHEY